MSQLPVPPSSLASSGGARSFLLVFQSLAHALAYKRLGVGKATMKIVEQARKGDDPVLVYGPAAHHLHRTCTHASTQRWRFRAHWSFVLTIVLCAAGTLNVLREMDVRVSGARICAGEWRRRLGSG
jgi:hypothetical protein